MRHPTDHRSTPAAPAWMPFLALPENRFAHLALCPAQPPAGEAPTLVYLYGPSGVGKSHLAEQALRDRIRERPRCRFVRLTAAEFAASFAEASEAGQIPKFQQQFRNLEIMIFEDLHALERRPETQRQFLSVMDDLRANGSLLILTARRPPGKLTDLSPKIIDRCRAGLLAPLHRPDMESRAALLKHFAQHRNRPLPEDVVNHLAEHAPLTPRELLGLIQQLETTARHRHRNLDLPFVLETLVDQPLPAVPTLPKIAKAVAQHFEISLAKLRSRARVQVLVTPRQCAMFLARELSGQRLGEIGAYFGGRNHSTVVHACTRLASLLPDQPELRQHLTQIRTHLGAD